jgi:hypothetical protein
MIHKHKCKGCDREFDGRRNKLFHDEECKANFNNQKASDIREELVDLMVMKKNFLLLKEFRSLYYDKPFLMKKIMNKGFDSTGPTRRIKTPLNGYEIFLIHSLGYRIYRNENIDYMMVYEKKDIDNY